MIIQISQLPLIILIEFCDSVYVGWIYQMEDNKKNDVL
jgi:hypothetical protein